MLLESDLTLEAVDRNELKIPQAVMDLFSAFESAGIRYCHWKSNLRLEKGLTGKTDLDLLVDEDAIESFRQVLEQRGVIAILAPRGKRYPGLEDYLGFDPETGTLFHLHVHYRLVLGEQFVKNYHLPLEKQILETTRVKDGIRTPLPEYEIIILAMRAMLKYRDRDVIKDVLSIRTQGIPSHIIDEFVWLLEQTSLEEIARVLAGIAHVIAPDVVMNVISIIRRSPRAGSRLFALRSQVRSHMRRYQRLNRFQAMAVYFVELWRRSKLFRSFQSERKMTLLTRGRTVAIVGADGSGKTTLSRALSDWLGWKLDVRLYYLGSKQPSWLSQVAYLCYRAARKSRRHLTGEQDGGNLILRLLDSTRQFFLYCHHLSIGIDRYRRFKAAKKNAAGGSVVIFDRFPLHDAMLDGAQIPEAYRGDHSTLTRVFSRLEKDLYNRFTQPDLVCVLNVSPEIAMQRKPDHREEAIQLKQGLLREWIAMKDGHQSGSRIFHVDAGLPFDEVLRQIKIGVWEAL